MSNLFRDIYYRSYQKVYMAAECFFDWSEPELLKGAGAVKKLPALVKSKGISSVLVVTDKGLMSLNLLQGLFDSLDAEGIRYVVYDGVQPNPSIENIEEARRLYLKNACEGIIAFGGGSPMDCAKAAGARITNPKKSVTAARIPRATPILAFVHLT